MLGWKKLTLNCTGTFQGNFFLTLTLPLKLLKKCYWLDWWGKVWGKDTDAPLGSSSNGLHDYDQNAWLFNILWRKSYFNDMLHGELVKQGSKNLDFNIDTYLFMLEHKIW